MPSNRISIQVTEEPVIRVFHLNYINLRLMGSFPVGQRLLSVGHNGNDHNSTPWAFLNSDERLPIIKILNLAGVTAITIDSPQAIKIEIDSSAWWEGGEEAIEPKILAILESYPHEGEIMHGHYYAKLK